MHRHRPLGITILGYWALAASGLMFIFTTLRLAGYSFSDEGALVIVLMSVGLVASPLGSGFVYFLPLSGSFAIYSYAALFFAAFLVIVGLHTLQARKWAWFANVGVSMFALVQHTFTISSLALFTSAGIESMVTPLSVIAVSVLRLYYLFRPNIRDLFNAWSISTQKQTA